MYKILLAGLAALTLAGPALADDRDDRRGWRDDRREWRDDRRDFRRDFRNDRRDFRDDRRDWRQDRRQGGYRNDWGNRGRDWRWNGARFRGPAYIHPRGYGYRPWNVGYRLPPAYFGNRYWIGDPGFYRLPPAWGGTRWVRVGPDALLIQIGNGIVLQAVRGLYW